MNHCSVPLAVKRNRQSDGYCRSVFQGQRFGRKRAETYWEFTRRRPARIGLGAVFIKVAIECYVESSGFCGIVNVAADKLVLTCDLVQWSRDAVHYRRRFHLTN